MHRQTFSLLVLLSALYHHGCAAAELESEISNNGVVLNPHSAMLGLNKTLTIWQIPNGQVKKVLFLAHSRQVGPHAYWDPHPNCPLCTGLPENRAFVLDALSRNYAVLAVETVSPGNDWEAWPQDSDDILNVLHILSTWVRDHDLENVPLVALGSSAGGHLLSTLSLRPGLFESIVIMISRGIPQSWELSNSYNPPTLFMHCPKDNETAYFVQIIMEMLHQNSVASEQVMWYEAPITPDWFAQRIPGLNESTSNSIRQVLKEAGVLDKQDYLALPNYDWTPLIRQNNLLPEDPFHPGKLHLEDHVQQELRVAEAFHVSFSTRNLELFKWFEGAYRKLPKSVSDI